MKMPSSQTLLAFPASSDGTTFESDLIIKQANYWRKRPLPHRPNWRFLSASLYSIGMSLLRDVDRFSPRFVVELTRFSEPKSKQPLQRMQIIRTITFPPPPLKMSSIASVGTRCIRFLNGFFEGSQ